MAEPVDRSTGRSTEPSLTDVGRSVERISRQQAKLEHDHKLLAGLIEQLARKVTALSNPPVDGPLHLSWLLPVDPDVAEEAIGALRLWVDAVYLQWPGTELPSCYLWHPWILEELWALWVAHSAAWDPSTGSVEKAGDWLERRRPGTVRRIRDTRSCRLRHHAEGGQFDGPVPASPLPNSAPRIARTWAINGYRHQQPYPTAHELQDADDYLQQQHRSND